MAKTDDTVIYQYEKVAIKDNEKAKDQDDVPFKYGYGVRHIQALLYFCSLSILFVVRAHLGVTVVAMIEPPQHRSHKITDIANITGLVEDAISTKEKRDVNADVLEESNQTRVGKFLKNITETESTWNVYRSYDWPKSTQEMVLGSFFLGYMIMMFPMGAVVQQWGGKRPLQVGLVVSGVVTFLTPWLAMWGGWKAVCLTRVFIGMAQAGTYPSLHTLVARWVPTSERARLSTYIYIGSMVGTIIAFQMGGFLAASPLGWPSIYWSTGVLCIIMFTLLTSFGAPTPAHHKLISNGERNFILGRIFTGVEKKRRIPWKAMARSRALWAAMLTHAGTSTSFIFFFTQAPSYVHFILGIDIKNSGLLSSLPYLANFVSSVSLGSLSDYCTNRGILSIKHARVISNTIANVGPALCLGLVTFTSNAVLGVLCLVVSLATHAGTHTGWMVNYIDLSPRYSGTLMATGNTLMNVMALMLPTLVSNIVTDVTNPYQWRIVMFVVGAIGLTGNAVFVAFMSAERQPWDDFDDQIDKKQLDEENNAVEEVKQDVNGYNNIKFK